MTKGRILLISNDKLFNLELLILLNTLDYEVCGSFDYSEISKEHTKLADPDIILFDVDLKTGFTSIVSDLKTYLPVPFVFLSQYNDKLTLENLQKFQPEAYLIKPFEDNELDIVLLNCIYRHKIEKNLKEKENELRNYKDIVEFSPVGIFQAELDGTLITVNNSLANILGYGTKEELINKNLDDLYFEYKVKQNSIATQAVKSERSFEVRWKRKNGDPLWVQLNVKFVLGIDSKPIYILGFVNDIDEKKKIKIGLAEVQARFHNTLKGNKIGLWDWHLKTDEFNVSQEWKNHLGYSYESGTITFEEWKKLIHPDDRQTVLKLLNEFVNETLPDYEVEYRMLHRDNSYRWILDRATLVKDSNGNPERILGSHLDISERKKIEYALYSAQARFNKFFESSPVGFGIIK